jgi:AcrR family transcriptional regulator
VLREDYRSPTQGRPGAAVALLDAAERVIRREGLASLTTRRVAKEADLNPGLVHYHFGSIDDLCVAVMGRVSARMLERQRRIFASEHPFAEQWRVATKPLRGGPGVGQMKVWCEFAVAAINRATLAPAMSAMNMEWRGIVVQALQRECERCGRDPARLPIDALAALATVVLKGLYLEHLQDFHGGHAALLELADQFNSALGAGLGLFDLPPLSK